MQAYDQRQSQLTMDSFLSFSQRFAKIKSRRLQKAVAGITGTADAEIMLADADAGGPAAPVSKRAPRKKSGAAAAAVVAATAAGTVSAEAGGEAGGASSGGPEDAELEAAEEAAAPQQASPSQSDCVSCSVSSS